MAASAAGSVLSSTIPIRQENRFVSKAGQYESASLTKGLAMAEGLKALPDTRLSLDIKPVSSVSTELPVMSFDAPLNRNFTELLDIVGVSVDDFVKEVNEAIVSINEGDEAALSAFSYGKANGLAEHYKAIREQNRAELIPRAINKVLSREDFHAGMRKLTHLNIYRPLTTPMTTSETASTILTVVQLNNDDPRFELAGAKYKPSATHWGVKVGESVAFVNFDLLDFKMYTYLRECDPHKSRPGFAGEALPARWNETDIEALVPDHRTNIAQKLVYLKLLNKAFRIGAPRHRVQDRLEGKLSVVVGSFVNYAYSAKQQLVEDLIALSAIKTTASETSRVASASSTDL